MTAPVIDYYLSPVSPWTYLGAARFRKLAARHQAKVNVFIVDLGLVFPETGGLPLPKRAPQRQAYRLQELARFGEYLNLPLNLKPAYFPPSSPLANIALMAVREGYGTGSPARLRSPATQMGKGKRYWRWGSGRFRPDRGRFAEYTGR